MDSHSHTELCAYVNWITVVIITISGGPPPLSPNTTGTFQIEIEDLSPTDNVPSESGHVYDSGLGELEDSTTPGVGLDDQEEAVSQGGMHLEL